MKTRTLSLFTAVFAVILQAAPARAGLDLGIVAGPAFDTQNILSANGGTSSTSNETYGAGGPWCNLIFPDSVFGISGGLLFAETGAKTQSAIFGSPASYDVRTPWLQIPVMMSVWPTFSSVIGIGVGVYAGIPLGQTESVGTFGSGASLLNYSNAGVDFGVAAGVQVKVPVGILTFLELNVLYEDGLVDVDTNGNNIRNNTLLVMGGFGLGF